MAPSLGVVELTAALKYPRGNVPERSIATKIGMLESGAHDVVFESDNANILILPVGHLVAEAVSAAEALKAQGIINAVKDIVSEKLQEDPAATSDNLNGRANPWVQ